MSRCQPGKNKGEECFQQEKQSVLTQRRVRGELTVGSGWCMRLRGRKVGLALALGLLESGGGGRTLSWGHLEQGGDILGRSSGC